MCLTREVLVDNVLDNNNTTTILLPYVNLVKGDRMHELELQDEARQLAVPFGNRVLAQCTSLRRCTTKLNGNGDCGTTLQKTVRNKRVQKLSI